MKKLNLIIILLFLLLSCRVKNDQKTERSQIHPYFMINNFELKTLTKDLPEDIQANILKRPEYFLQLVNDILNLPEAFYKLVDKENTLTADYIPKDLVSLKQYKLSISKDDLSLRKIIMPDLVAMNEAAKSKGVNLVISSSYRSHKYQEKVYKRNVLIYGQETADRESAQPGKSQHQLGTVIDFGSISDEFAYTEAGKWLKENAWEYGFSISYPENYEWLTGYRGECWHFRYISRTGTSLEKEFFGGIQQHMFLFLNKNQKYFKGKIIASE